MKTLSASVALALVALAPLASQAQDQAQNKNVAQPYAGEIQLTPRVPGTGTVQTDISSSPGPTAPGAPAVATSVSGSAPAGALVAAPVAGLPSVPGVVASPEQTASPGQAVTPPPGEPLTKNFVPGQPVPTYATLQEAAAAGVEPMPELSLNGASAEPTQQAVAFDWMNPQAYLAWAKAHLQGPTGYGVGGAFVLLAGLWLWMRSRRADEAAWEDDEE